MKVISYNLRKNRASGELIALAERYDPDILCLQECDTLELPAEVGLLHLADWTVRNRLGLAIYYRRDRFTTVKTQTFALKKSVHDRLLTPAHERLIGTRLVDLVEQREIVVASFHAAPLTALNSLRRNQIRSAHDELHELGPGLPTLMVGDYNYPIFKQKLSAHVNESGYDLTLSDTVTYTRYKFFQGHFDLATSVGLSIDNVATLPSGTSDHMPILVTSSYSADKPMRPLYVGSAATDRDVTIGI
ncbi:endonuclease/exonuclease/phosphatase family protein [Cryobacterium psychrophilum]|uniref:Endonuclease/exonuclease/phosphatase family protein n=1 Tax=Cryobacterium psychrophilum TaxID=41988 RepID=A0A4Y8KPZ7_9MICO|nr:endonuclease/exonuclease/phosphatase family protein [Cryobacterium psychrophilum]TDW29324.1 endonuclease/exonuclease/phosphatase family protein [Cryobacterium psychrophilum]TFD79998.1 endonuclease/exonuclease/phosphatase family protein [Cryobacterium psychrophilum]